MLSGSPIAAVSWGSGRFDVFGIGTDTHMYHKAFEGNWKPSVDGWDAIGGDFASAPRLGDTSRTLAPPQPRPPPPPPPPRPRPDPSPAQTDTDRLTPASRLRGPGARSPARRSSWTEPSYAAPVKWTLRPSVGAGPGWRFPTRRLAEPGASPPRCR